MSWWGPYILSGDTPWDWLGDLAEVVGVPQDIDADDALVSYPFTREVLEKPKSLKKIYAMLRKEKDPIAGQVVGATFLWAGAEIPEALKTRVIEDARRDEWATEDPERKLYTDELIEKVENHKPGERVELSYESLMGKIADMLGG